jgi:hypothetical protein
MGSAKRTEGEPHDRLTRMCDAAIQAFEAHPEHRDGDKAIVFLDDGGRGGIVLHGYDSDVDAMADLLMHLKALFEANGRTLMVIPVGEG